MTRDESQIMKGVAILLMLFLHLFNQSGNVAICENLFFIGGEPLALVMSRATNPVAFFLVLGGYGLYTVWQRGDKHRYSRLLKLVIHYWVILALFLGIGHCMKPDMYPGSVEALVKNVTAFHTTYNDEMWFLLPYLVLSLLSPYLFQTMRRFRARYVIAATFAIHICTSFCISRYGAAYLFHNLWVYNPLLVLHLLFDFTLGAMAVRCRVFERLKAMANVYSTQCKWRYSILCMGGNFVVRI